MNKILLKVGGLEKEFFYIVKNSIKSKKIKLKIIDENKMEIILPKKKYFDKIFASFFSVENFLEKNKIWIFKNCNKFSKLKISHKTKLTQKNWKKNQKEFLKIAVEKTIFFNHFYNFEYKKISIRDQKSRWGSCSSKGNLNFNYRIFLLPEEERDYVIIHELCHLGEMNHSKNFWNLVAKKSPNHKVIRQKLKKYYF